MIKRLLTLLIPRTFSLHTERASAAGLWFVLLFGFWLLSIFLWISVPAFTSEAIDQTTTPYDEDVIAEALDDMDTIGNEVLQSPKENSIVKQPDEVKTFVTQKAQGQLPLIPLEEVMVDVLEIKDKNINEVLGLLAERYNLNFVIDPQVRGKVTIYLNDVNMRDALRIILDTNELAYSQENGIIRVMTAQQFEAKYGYPFGQNIQTEIIPLRFVEREGILDILQQMQSPSGKVMYNERTHSLVLMDLPENLQSMVALVKQLDTPMEHYEFTLQHIEVEKIAKEVQSLLTPNVGRLQFDVVSNHMIVTDTSEKIQQVTEKIKELDKKENKFFIEAKIIQILLNEEHLKGVDWEAIVSDYQSLDFDGFDMDKLGHNALSFGTVSAEDYEILLDALDTVGVINNISNIQLIAADEERLEVIVKAMDLYLAKRNGQQEILEENEKVKFQLTPRLKDKQILSIDIEPLVMLLLHNPQEEKKQQKITVDVETQTTIVIGSLFKEVTVESLKKIPLLGDLPFVGFAFRNEREMQQKSEVIVFLTPKVVEEEDDVIK